MKGRDGVKSTNFIKILLISVFGVLKPLSLYITLTIAKSPYPEFLDSFLSGKNISNLIDERMINKGSSWYYITLCAATFINAYHYC